MGGWGSWACFGLGGGGDPGVVGYRVSLAGWGVGVPIAACTQTRCRWLYCIDRAILRVVGGGGGVWLRWDDDVCFDLERSCLFFDGGERGTAVGVCLSSRPVSLLVVTMDVSAVGLLVARCGGFRMVILWWDD